MKKFSSEQFIKKSPLNGIMSCLEASGLTAKNIEELARETNFKKRNSGKMSPAVLLAFVVLGALNGRVSFNDLSISHDIFTGITVSRQAIHQRFTKEFQSFIEKILHHILSSQVHKRCNLPQAKTLPYKRVLIQDSTIIKLPRRLFETFSGVSNSTSQICNSRIQTVYDALDGEFTFFSIDSYRKNDLAAAPELELQKGDLVLRDRGYLTYAEVDRHIRTGSDCIYRHKNNSLYISIETNKPIDLLAELTQYGTIDKEVFLNNPERTRVRLLASPVSEEIANIRRMKLKKEQKGHNPSKDNLVLQSWTIFITTIPAEKASFMQILKIYSLRWRIETIFKSWKSNANFAQIHNVPETQLRIIITARLIMSALTMKHIFTPASTLIRVKYQRELSLLKVMRYVTGSFEKLHDILQNIQDSEVSKTALISLMKYCLYDKRKRKNYNEEFNNILTDWSLA